MLRDTLATRAAVLRELNGEFSVEALALDPPRDDEILVRIVGVGICHTDAAVRAGHIPLTLPMVLGHEGSGIVERVGASVRKVDVGDHVVLSFCSCGTCNACRCGHPSGCAALIPLNFGGARPDGSHALHGHGELINDRFFAQSSFATYAVAPERNVVAVPRDVPLEILGPLGCGVQTGAGAVLNALQVGAADSLAVFGSGAVGLSAVMAARIVGATTIVAVDVVPSRLVLAIELGATHVIDARGYDASAQLAEICPDGFRFGLDTTGRPDVIHAAIKSVSTRGVCGILGATPVGQHAVLDVEDVITRCKRIVGIMGGDSIPDIFIPKLVEFYRQGRLPFDRMISFYPFERINEAFADAHAGRVVKPVIRMAAHVSH